jgi:uncharacterized membrane protein YkvA (DUF1232 family)
MFKRLTMLWNLMRGDARLLWFAVRHPDAPGWLKVATAVLAFYAVAQPITLPVLGFVDDMILVPLALRFLVKRIPPHIAAQAAARSAR